MQKNLFIDLAVIFASYRCVSLSHFLQTPTRLQVVQLVSKCGEQSGEGLQLAVLRALLTIGTAEHFVAHGDCLMQVWHRYCFSPLLW